jgi:hypothetical protein
MFPPHPRMHYYKTDTSLNTSATSPASSVLAISTADTYHFSNHVSAPFVPLCTNTITITNLPKENGQKMLNQLSMTSATLFYPNLSSAVWTNGSDHIYELISHQKDSLCHSPASGRCQKYRCHASRRRRRHL